MSLATPALAAVAAALATALLLRFRARLPQAVPNDRTLHAVPLPRVGGIAIWAGLAPVIWFAPAMPAMRVALWGPAWLLLFAVSLRDDVKSVAVVARLAVHALAATWFAVALLAGAEVAAAWIAVAALVVAWSLNLYNFMDGSDGLAAAMSVVGFGAYGTVLLLRGEPAALPFCVAAASLPVLAVNLPPARMFLGDVGAVPLGFLAAALGVSGIAAGAWPAWFPLLVFLPFVADATATLARRVLARERFWQSHRSHYYQRLHQLGAGHAGTLAAYGALMLGCAATAVACAWARPQWGAAALGFWCIVHAGLFAAIDYHWRRSANFQQS